MVVTQSLAASFGKAQSLLKEIDYENLDNTFTSFDFDFSFRADKSRIKISKNSRQLY